MSPQPAQKLREEHVQIHRMDTHRNIAFTGSEQCMTQIPDPD